jgi:hypothetical protein
MNHRTNIPLSKGIRINHDSLKLTRARAVMLLLRLL